MTIPSNIDYQEMIQQLTKFTHQRFGVYLDMKSGFSNNLKALENSSPTTPFLMENVSTIGEVFTNTLITPENQSLLVWGRCPPFDLFDPRRCVVHTTTLKEFKENNDIGGINHNFAIENCITDIFNFWKVLFKEFNLNIKTREVFPIMDYLGQLRNRVQHDLYGKRIVTQKVPIKLEKAIIKYNFPNFEHGDNISLTDRDIEAIVSEIDEQLNTYLIPYLKAQTASA